ncbi:MAG TPA: M56 family metallopeptidase [Planctomycetaceae bacterium]|nr:M56 family metallopeptidase [Planctomycetaceae bacterium]
MNEWAALLIDGLWRASWGTAIAGVAALLMVGRFRQGSPRWQQAICLLVLAQGWLLAPIVFEVPWYKAHISGASHAVAPTRTLVTNNEIHPTVTETDDETTQSLLASGPAIARPVDWRIPVAGLWLAGIVGLFLLAVVRYVRFVMRARDRQPVDSEAQELWNALCARWPRCRRFPELQFTHELGPLLCRLPEGYRVLVPVDLWSSLNAAQRRAILLHELSHWERGDVWRNLAAWLLALPQWFNPFAWWAHRRFTELGEWACDDAVTVREPECVPEYSRAILHTRARRAPLLAAGAAIGSQSRLMVRLRRLLSTSPREIPMSWKIACVAGFLALFVATAVRVELIAQEVQDSAPPKAEVRTDPEVETAMQKGLAFLRKAQGEAGGWTASSNAPLNDGLTSLCAFALLRSGVNADDPALKRALALIRAHSDEYTYAVALDVLALCEANRLSDLELIRRKVAWLESAQVTEGESRGSWGYVRVNAGRGDGSNSRFAVLALEAADKVGIKASGDTWKRIAEYWATHQSSDGGWGYVPKAPATRNMTCAGIMSLSILSARSAENSEQHAKAVEQGLAWLARHAVPGHEALNQAHGYYYTHALEQAVRTSHSKQLGEVDWRADLQRALLKAQDPETGGWNGKAENAVISTCFALLFLANEE